MALLLIMCSFKGATAISLDRSIHRVVVASRMYFLLVPEDIRFSSPHNFRDTRESRHGAGLKNFFPLSSLCSHVYNGSAVLFELCACLPFIFYM